MTSRTVIPKLVAARGGDILRPSLCNTAKAPGAVQQPRESSAIVVRPGLKATLIHRTALSDNPGQDR